MTTGNYDTHTHPLLEKLVTEHRCPALLQMTALRLTLWGPEASPSEVTESRMTCSSLTHRRYSSEQTERQATRSRPADAPSPRLLRTHRLPPNKSTWVTFLHGKQEGLEMKAQSNLPLLLTGELSPSPTDSEDPRVGRTWTLTERHSGTFCSRSPYVDHQPQTLSKGMPRDCMYPTRNLHTRPAHPLLEGAIF